MLGVVVVVGARMEKGRRGCDGLGWTRLGCCEARIGESHTDWFYAGIMVYMMGGRGWDARVAFTERAPRLFSNPARHSRLGLSRGGVGEDVQPYIRDGVL